MAVGISCLQRQWLPDPGAVGTEVWGSRGGDSAITGPSEAEQAQKSSSTLRVCNSLAFLNKALNSFCAAADRLNHLLSSFSSAEFLLSI